MISNQADPSGDALKAYHLVNWLFLKTDLNPDDMESVIRELQRKGVNGFFMHPRTGMEVEYLSEDYWERISFIVEKARELGMQVWIYDDYNWPSGAVGGRLLRDYPEYRQTYLDHVRQAVEPGQTVEIAIDGELLAAVAVRSENGEVVPLEDRVKDCVLSWSPANGSWNVLVFTEKLVTQVFFNTTGTPFSQGEPGYVDLLNPEAVAKFIELTLDEYAKRFKGYFGTVIPGVMTDEPGNYMRLAWTHSFPELFQQEKGYELLPRLYHLVLEAGDYVITRQDYHEVAVKLYETAFYKQIRHWCDRNGLIFTGHIMCEEDLRFLPAMHGGFFPILRHMHMPGYDYLADITGYEPFPWSDQWGSNLGAKEASSTAHATGADRTFCEIFGGCGWQTSLAKLINVINWASACGTNFFTPHATSPSIKGLSKRDFPPSHFVQEPWWKYYHHFSSYVERQSRMSSIGVHVADVLLLYPLRTLWVEHTAGGLTDKYRVLKDSFYAVVNGLLRIQRDYDFLFEESVLGDEVEVAGNRLCVKDETFRVLVLPPTTTIPLALARLLRRFYDSGGLIVAVGQLPNATEKGAGDPELAEVMTTIFGREATERSPQGSQAAITAENENGGKAMFLPVDGLLTMEAGESLLRTALDALLPRDISIDAPETRDFIALHRRDGDTEYYFVANLSDRPMEANIALNATGSVQLTDLLDESRSQVPVYRIEDGKVTVPWTFEGGQGIWISVSQTSKPQAHVQEGNIILTGAQISGTVLSVEGYTRETNPYVQVNGRRVMLKQDRVLAPISIREPWEVSTVDPNIYVINPWKVQVSGAEWKTMETSRYTPLSQTSGEFDAFTQALGFDMDSMGAYEILDIVVKAAGEAGYLPPTFSPGARYVAEASFEVDYLPDDITLVYEDLGQPVQIHLNERLITDLPTEEIVWDKCNRVVTVRDYLKRGKNTIRFESSVPLLLDKFPCNHGLEPVVLRGSFVVRDQRICRPEANLPIGDWRSVGFPNYSGEIGYRQKFDLPNEYLDKKLMVEISDVRETVEVWLNGKKIVERIVAPFAADITEAAVPGGNTLELRVNNTAENLLGTPVPSGLLGGVAVVPYNVCRANVEL